LSVTSTIKLLQRVANLPDNRLARIFYVSDFDPAGDQMPVAVARQIEFYLEKYADGCEVKLTPLALTREQVVQYNLPRKPIKANDKRRGNFEDRRGEGAVELDALEALRPGELERLIREAAEPYRDPDIEERLQEAREEAQVLADEAWDAATSELRQELEQLQQQAREIAERYEKRARRLDAEMQAELAAVRQRLEASRRAVQEAWAEFTV